MTGVVARMKVCLNGGRSTREHAATPITPDQLAVSAAAAVAAGAEAVHLHPRRAGGAESLHVTDVGAAVAAVRRACPGTGIGVSTGLWMADGNVARRRSLVQAWSDLLPGARPDFASVNVHERGFADLTGDLLAMGIAVEAGVWSARDADRLAASGVATAPIRVLVEVVGAARSMAVAAADAVLARLDATGSRLPRLLHGEDDACWPLVAHAGRLGLPTRIGLEDTLTGPRGEPVSGNADLVRLGLEAWQLGAHRRPRSSAWSLEVRPRSSTGRRA